MTESRWPLGLLIIGVLMVFFVVLVGLVWLVSASDLPGWLKTLLNLLFTGFFVTGGNKTRRRIEKGKSPWSLKEPERG